MEFGVISLFDFHPDIQREVPYYQHTIQMAVDAEALGFNSIWVGQEHFYHFGICPNPAVFLSAIARETTRLRLGTAVALTSFDHPLRRAEDFAMVDVISNGRLNMGFGRGAIPKHFEGFDGNATESKARYEESLAIIKQAWTQDEVSYDGTFWRVPPIAVSPRPIQTPHPPIWRGTVSEESFTRAGEEGDNAFIVPWARGLEDTRRCHQMYRDALRAHGHEGKTKTTGVFFVFLDRDHRAAVREGREHAERYTRLINTAARNRKKDTPTHQPKSTLFELQERILSTSERIEERGIVGTPERAIEQIKELSELFGGLDELVFYPHAGGRSPELGLKTMRLFAEEVMPAFQGVVPGMISA